MAQLSRLEGKPGTAERPLSDLGAVSFRSYWQRAVLDCLRDNQKGDISIQVWTALAEGCATALVHAGARARKWVGRWPARRGGDISMYVGR